ncbi:MAG: hypothetical protein IMZ67_01175 [Acidobacteria bacterium]|nr:hypothetical protein [Acidobacteriota bacterium]
MPRPQAPAERTVPPMRVQVLGPDSADLSPADLRRLFRGRRMTPARRQRLAGSGRVVAACGARVVGLAAYERTADELRVHEFAVDEVPPCQAGQVADALLEALEVACLAGGERRLVLLPRAAVAAPVLRAHGFATIAEECAGSWFMKSFPF